MIEPRFGGFGFGGLYLVEIRTFREPAAYHAVNILVRPEITNLYWR